MNTLRGGKQMRCYCCDAAAAIVRKVKLRPFRKADDGANKQLASIMTDVLSGAITPPISNSKAKAAYEFYVKEMTYRWAIVCLPCYRALDNECGLAEVGGR